ncbi:uncharacterized protein [Nicotiana tomentosiformis]|uniref:uncharacterized protein n=1 Tax=Nicotiana tomentosiformis TaxID=4098 RepID=UPI00388C6D43
MTKEVHRLASLGVRFLDSEDGGVVIQNRIESSLVAEVKEKQLNDPYLLQLKEGIHKHKTMDFEQGGDDGTLRYRGRLCVPDTDGLKERIMSEAHNSRKLFDYMGLLCPSSQIVVLSSQPTFGNPFRKDWACVIDFKGNWDDHLPLIEFTYNNSYHSRIKMALYEALYGQRCRSPIGWFKVSEVELLGPNLVYRALDKVNLIQEHLKMAQSRKKYYLDVRHRDLEFQVDD